MIAVKKVFNPNHREYRDPFLEEVIPKKEIAYYCPYMRDLDFLLYGASRVSSLGWKIIKSLGRISGVESIFFFDGSVSVTKGVAFEWQEIEPKIISILKFLMKNPEARPSFENETGIPRCVASYYWNSREYNLNKIVFLGRSWNSNFSLDVMKDLDSPINKVVYNLLNSPMVEEVILGFYSISIKKNPKYEWGEVEILLKSVLKEFFDFPIEKIIHESDFNFND